ncbi:histidinol-phosphate transaminase domain protein [Lentilactobacillus parafarraginis F0439]|uniref:histidinol-phosphate transaminase n=1 Tax=Lentilactobacillus parafarraginis F0439 TaxID=797515 RepID=G9ZTI1_9LACO|nr:histidinol-phosphate transaminase domain protein [Lentilactobacillus parafarraginis F0439]
MTDPQALERFIADLPDHVWVVVDEAYADFAKPEHLPNLLQFIGHKRVLILRTMSKAYGLAGARLGFLLGEPTAIAAYDTVTEPFNSNRSVLAATIASFKYDQPQFKRALKRIWGDKVGLTESLEILGCEVARSDANFVFVKLPDGAPSATEVTNQLMAQGVIVRDGTPWGYPDHIRVTIGKHDELEFFLEKFQEILNE